MKAMSHPIASASAALPAAKTSELALVARNRRLPSTASKFARLHSPPRRISTTLACSRNSNGGSTSAASTTMSSAATSGVCRSARRESTRLSLPLASPLPACEEREGRRALGKACDPNRRLTSAFSPKQIIIDLLPGRHVVLGLFRREEARAEMAGVGRERRGARGQRGIRRQVLGGAEYLLAFARDDEIDQELRR